VGLMDNGSSSGTHVFVHGSFKIAKVIFVKVEIVEYVSIMCTSSATVGIVINGRLHVGVKLCNIS
jgi:hypothetical protein